MYLIIAVKEHCTLYFRSPQFLTIVGEDEHYRIEGCATLYFSAENLIDEAYGVPVSYVDLRGFAVATAKLSDKQAEEVLS